MIQEDAARAPLSRPPTWATTPSHLALEMQAQLLSLGPPQADWRPAWTRFANRAGRFAAKTGVWLDERRWDELAELHELEATWMRRAMRSLGQGRSLPIVPLPGNATLNRGGHSGALPLAEDDGVTDDQREEVHAVVASDAARLPEQFAPSGGGSLVAMNCYGAGTPGVGASRGDATGLRDVVRSVLQSMVNVVVDRVMEGTPRVPPTGPTAHEREAMKVYATMQKLSDGVYDPVAMEITHHQTSLGKVVQMQPTRANARAQQRRFDVQRAHNASLARRKLKEKPIGHAESAHLGSRGSTSSFW